VKIECRACAHFRNDAATLAAALPGLGSLSSMQASVRGDDGLCERHQRYCAASSACADFAAVSGAGNGEGRHNIFVA
jgi:hypothetical protein